MLQPAHGSGCREFPTDETIVGGEKCQLCMWRFSASTSVWSIPYSLMRLKLQTQPYLFSIYSPWVWFYKVFSISQVGCSDCSLRTGLRPSWIFQPVSNFYERIGFQNKLQLYFRKIEIQLAPFWPAYILTWSLWVFLLD